MVFEMIQLLLLLLLLLPLLLLLLLLLPLMEMKLVLSNVSMRISVIIMRSETMMICILVRMTEKGYIQCYAFTIGDAFDSRLY
jgi:hypothetical protein